MTQSRHLYLAFGCGFRFTGKLNKLTFELGPTQLTSDDHQLMQHPLAKGKDKRAAVWKLRACLLGVSAIARRIRLLIG
jgi:hypothetical protein